MSLGPYSSLPYPVNNSAVNCLYNKCLYACPLPPIRSTAIAHHSRQVKHISFKILVLKVVSDLLFVEWITPILFE